MSITPPAPGWIPVHRVRSVAVSIFVCLSAFLLPGPGEAQIPPDIGIVMSVAGEVRYDNPADMDQSEPVQAFMKVRRGDRIFLSDGGRIDLLFLEEGRREIWNGPARLTLSSDGARSGKREHGPEVTKVRAPVSMAIEESGLPLPRGQIARGGVGVVRGLFKECPERARLPRPVPSLPEPDRAALDKARTLYGELRRQTHPADPLPDLYYLSVLSRYRRFGEMDRIVDRLRQIHGQLPALRKWASWIDDNYPLRLIFYLLSPDEKCRRGPACFSLGDLGHFRKSGPCPASELGEKQIRTGDILTFALTNTSDTPLYCAVINIDPAGRVEHLFPQTAGESGTAPLEPGDVLDFFSDTGIGLMPAAPGREIIRVYLSPTPFSEPDLAHIEKGTTDHLETIDATLHVSERPS